MSAFVASQTGANNMLAFRMIKCALLTISIGVLGYATPAVAQYGNDCSIYPTAPGCPGESTSSGGGDQSVPANVPPGGRYAVAQYKDANTVWIAANYLDENEAILAAKAACNAAMGGGCEDYGWGYHHYLVVYRYADGSKSYSNGPTPQDAERAMREQCRKEKTTCVVIERVDSRGQTGPMEIYPKDNFRRIYAAAAQPKKKPATDAGVANVFIASGYATRNEAEITALQTCANEAKAKCVIAKSIADTFIITGTDEKNRVWVTASHTKELSAEQLKQLCNPKNSLCKVTGAFSAKDKGVQTFDAYGKERKQ